ncbi:MAG TPA: AMP-dependent synthetase/ligase, partial [Pirellulaceae bacterium]|nr:AMP-dependent synthetase/ligase [Pirellulaceae bacterium]
RLASAIVSLGVQPGDRVALVSENRYEWIITDLAIQLALAVHVPIQPTLAGPQIAWQLRHCGCRVTFISGPHQAAKLAPLAAELPTGLQCISFDPCQSTDGFAVEDFARLCERGNPAEGHRLEKIAREKITPQSLATILYTSGTTGEPKGVMLTQGNLASNVCNTIQASEPTDNTVRLNLLPLSHIFARTCDLYGWLVEGSRMALAESRETVLADCQAVHPTTLNGVPYFYDKVYRGLCASGKQNTPGALRAELGGAIERCCAGGAALPDHLYEYFHAQGVPLIQGYGLSESSPVITISTLTHHRRGSCGRPIPGIEVRIADDGEILTRGPHVMTGYYQNPQATADVLKGGWLATGDIGRLDADGFLYITGRKKEILVTSGGKNIAPVFLESLLTQDPLILQAMVIGDARSYLAALIVPNADVLKSELSRRGIVASHEAALAHPEILALYRARIDHQLAGVSPHEQVRKFTLLPRPFSIEAGELTPKLSLRRQTIGERYKAQIEAMYSQPQVQSLKPKA